MVSFQHSLPPYHTWTPWQSKHWYPQCMLHTITHIAPPLLVSPALSKPLPQPVWRGPRRSWAKKSAPCSLSGYAVGLTTGELDGTVKYSVNKALFAWNRLVALPFIGYCVHFGPICVVVDSHMRLVKVHESFDLDMGVLPHAYMHTRNLFKPTAYFYLLNMIWGSYTSYAHIVNSWLHYPIMSPHLVYFVFPSCTLGHIAALIAS